jgi:hypothetical protein
MKLSAMTLAVLSTFLLAGPAMATTINIDFNDAAADNSPTYSGTAAATGTGTVWNGIDGNGGANITVSTLVDSFGNEVVGAGVSVAMYGVRGGGTPDSPSAAGPATHDAEALMQDYFYARFGRDTYPGEITLTGIDPAKTFDLYLYGGGDQTSQNSRFTYDGLSKSTAAPDAAVTALIEDVNYVVFRNINATQAGEIFFTLDRPEADTDYSAINGLQLVEVPEPTTLSLLALGGLGAIVRRRRA